MEIQIKVVTTKQEKKEYVSLLFDLYKDNKYWVPPIKSEELDYLTEDTNPFMSATDCKFWLAYIGKKCVGRVGAIVHHAHIEKCGEKLGRLTGFEAIDDSDVIDALFNTAEGWLKEQGMEAVAGPLGFSNLDHQGVLVEGFDQLQSVASIYHLPHYKDHFERLGYKKDTDWVEFRLNIDGMVLNEKTVRICEIVKKRFKLEVKHFTSSKEIMSYSKEIFEIMNESFKELFSVTELDTNMIEFYSKKYLQMLDPKYVKIIVDEEQKCVGFTIGMPSMSEALRKANGKLLPFGIVHILKAMKKPEVCDTLLTGIHPKYQSSGAGAILFSALLQEMLDNNVKFIETTGMLETNHKAISNWKNFDYVQHKRKRCYRKDF